MKNLINLFKDESGQGMVEYGLIIAVVALVVVVALTTLGGSLKTMFGNADAEITKNRNPTP